MTTLSIGGTLGSKEDQLVELSVFDATGREVKTLVSSHHTPGHYEVIWNGRDNKGLQCSSDVYFVRMRSEEFNANARLVLIR
ncbi:MAG: hypothetical protein E3J71_06760 [Candidatus Stahlbacteria bacterium]|nr:MAG: hypothetical protein E3J71_06760 [Candidatus Stahlbacteria bacterium]